jgi:hypothetical protein
MQCFHLQDNSKSAILLECVEKTVLRTCDENVQKSDTVGIGSCTMTMPPPTQPLSVQQFFAKNQNDGCVPPPHTHPTSLLATFFFVPTDAAGFAREAFC